MKRLRPVITVLFVFITIAFSFSFATSSHAITITGSETITTSSNTTYTATDCSGSVSWSVTGTGASINSNGVLTAGSASCGGITVTASCSDGSIATKTVRVTDAGQWVLDSYTIPCPSNCGGGSCESSINAYDTCISGNTKTVYGLLMDLGGYCSSSCPSTISGSTTCLCSLYADCSPQKSNCSLNTISRCYYLCNIKVYDWQCPSCTNGQTLSCYTGSGGTQGVGECKAGTQTCSGGQWGACDGEVTPVAEICGDNLDNNCNGLVDVGCQVPENNLGKPEDIDEDSCKAKGSPVWAVNKINLNLYVTDIPVWYNPSIGPSVNIQLSYNSHSAIVQNAPFGNKWMLNYGSYLIQNADNSITVFMPDGREDTFAPDGQGGYIKPLGVFNTLTEVAVNHFELKFLDGTIYVYKIPIGTSLTNPYLIEIKDAYNQTLTIGYNSSNQLETITDATGKITKLTYNTNGLVERIDERFGEPLSRFATFQYDANRNLTMAVDMGGYWTNYIYETNIHDGNVYLSGITNIKGTWQFKIEPSDGTVPPEPYPAPDAAMGENYRITITDPLGQKEEYYYYSYSGQYSWYVSQRDYVPYVDVNNNNFMNAAKTYYYLDRTNPKGEISKIQYPEGGYIQYSDFDTVTGKPKTISDYHGNDTGGNPITHSTQYTYNSNGLVTSLLDARAKTTTYEYYPNNIDLWKIINPLGTVEFTYNGNTHDIATIKDRLNNITRFTYDNTTGQLTSITEAEGTAVQTVTELVYDAATYNLTEIKKNSNTITSFVPDEIGRISTKTDATGLTLGYEYNNLDQITKILYPDTVYDTNNNPLSKYIDIQRSSCCPHIIDSITDRAGLTTVYTHDALKRLTKVQGPDGTYDFEYDANGNLTKLIDSNRTPAVETVFEYNLDNVLKKKIYADGKFVEYIPDKMGLLTTFKNARQTTKTHTYDGNHNLLSIDYSDTTPDVTFIYDDYNRVLTSADGTGTYNYTYYADDRLWTVDGPLANDTITYQYNELGNLKTLIPQLGQTLTYRYDYESTDPLVKKIGRLLNIQKGTDTFTYGYTDVNPLIQRLTRPNGSITEYSYNDPLKRLTDVINKNSSLQVINSYNYTYYTSGTNTDLIQHETITNGEPIDTFVTGTTTYTNNNLNQLISTSNPNRTFTHDNDGNMTTGFTPEGYTLTMTYDAENSLTSAQYIDSTNVIHRTEYFYSGDSLLAEMKKYDNGALTSTTRYIRTGSLPVQERDASNAINREYVWGLNLGGGIGGLLNLKQNTSDYFYLYDGKGNVSSLIDSSQSIVTNYRYDPFGVLMKKTATIDQPYMFSTKQYDSQTGLSYYGYRFYNPETGKWTSRDPLEEAGGINLYQMTGNNPVNAIDPLGLWSSGAHDAILQYAFGNSLSRNEIARLQQSSRNFDRRTQSANQSYMHSMRQKGQTIEQGIRLRDQFIADTLNAARKLAESGDRNEALDIFGEACHPIMDSSSPMHVDANGNPRVWNPWWPFGHSPNEFIGDETVDDLTQAILIQQKQLLNKAYERVFGP